LISVQRRLACSSRLASVNWNLSSWLRSHATTSTHATRRVDRRTFGLSSAWRDKGEGTSCVTWNQRKRFHCDKKQRKIFAERNINRSVIARLSIVHRLKSGKYNARCNSRLRTSPAWERNQAWTTKYKVRDKTVWWRVAKSIHSSCAIKRSHNNSTSALNACFCTEHLPNNTISSANRKRKTTGRGRENTDDFSFNARSRDFAEAASKYFKFIKLSHCVRLSAWTDSTSNDKHLD